MRSFDQLLELLGKKLRQGAPTGPIREKPHELSQPEKPAGTLNDVRPPPIGTRLVNPEAQPPLPPTLRRRLDPQPPPPPPSAWLPTGTIRHNSPSSKASRRYTGNARLGESQSVPALPAVARRASHTGLVPSHSRAVIT